MFAVPGWSVSASSLVREQVRSKKPDSTNKAKKRKHSVEDLDTNTDLLSQTPAAEASNESNDDEVSSKRPRKSDRSQVEKTQQNPGLSQSQSSYTGDNRVNTKNELNESLGRKQERHKKQLRGRGATDDGKQQDTGAHKGLPQRSLVLESSAAPLPAAKLTPLQAKMRSKLTSARFRHLNETLYTTSSADALKLFTSSPELFTDYHAGFAQQVKDSWPQNPVEGYVKSIRARGSLPDPQQGVVPLPRRKTGSCTIADLGCGDAPLARGCQAVVRSLKLKFHNYDLHPANSFVAKADVSNLPLRDGEIDIAVFCLSLMGTNWIDFVEEAWRVLRGDGKGEVWVAEVKSRFGRVTKGRVVENSVGKRRKNQKPKKDNKEDEFDGPIQFVEDERAPAEDDDETDITAFVKVFTRRGFQLKDGSVNKRNKMFVSMIFTKTGIPTAGRHKGLKWNGKEYQKQQEVKMKLGGGGKQDDEEVTAEEEGKALKACVYKVR